MKLLNTKYLILLFIVLFFFSPTFASCCFVAYVFLDFYFKLNTTIAFREFLVLIYTINYLLSPILTYTYGDSQAMTYGMKITKEEYLDIAFPCLIIFYFGIFMIKTDIFNINIKNIKISGLLNETILKQWVIYGIVLSFISKFKLPTEINFFVYLLSTIRFIGAFGLIMINFTKFKTYISVVLFYEISNSVIAGLFHDVAMWLIFLTLIIFFIYKLNNFIKISIFTIGILSLFLLQSTKGDYREATWRGTEEAGFSSFTNVASSKLDDKEGFFSQDNLINSITRVNQGWIFASTINQMNSNSNFQGFTLILQYIEAGVLPRFLSPNKLKAGDKKIFNDYSGHFIGEGTSMGLGIFADGYVSFGYWGAIFFALGYGLLYSLVFYIAGIWSKTSPFFFLFLLPILFYAVRPDCETQTSLGHLIKSTLVFAILVQYYKGYFKKANRTINLLNLKT